MGRVQPPNLSSSRFRFLFSSSNFSLSLSIWLFFPSSSFFLLIGYGNQAPMSTKARLLVGMLGWVSIICWAMILFVAGKVLGIVIDDVFRRCRRRSWTGEIGGVIVWGFIAACWIFVVGSFASGWFNYSFEPNEFEIFNFWDETSPKSLSLGDAFWFAYISLLTVGMYVAMYQVFVCACVRALVCLIFF
jgi:hypothetical protein